jgi:UDP-N-acetyl-D-glucosamine/UDP-N-acetyl-D-galactosamine dehydrogenase
MEADQKIAVIGLGYVGLPLAVEFAKKFIVIGFDTDRNRIGLLRSGIDSNRELEDGDLKSVFRHAGSTGLSFTDQISDIGACNCFIITVPTPINKNNQPDLSLLIEATETIGRILKIGDLVIYESTVYPGATEELCAPLLEKTSGLIFNKDFFCGYSPERINPGDKLHSISKILKITSGSRPEIAIKVDKLYKTVIEAGTYLAPSIRIAEAAKLVENSQRDINIAFVNELAKIFNLLKIDTNEVLQAAGTKWNFMNFKPGLVGGHCIGAAPNYLAQKAREAGYVPEIITAGRKLNDSMGNYVAGETIKLMAKKEIPVKNARVLLLGFTFKENCPDIRNTRVLDIYNELRSHGALVSIYDPWANPDAVYNAYQITLTKTLSPENEKYDSIIISVAHKEFSQLNILELANKCSVIYDVKGIFNRESVDGRL